MTVWEEIQQAEGWFYEEETDGRVYQCTQCGDESYDRFQFIFIPTVSYTHLRAHETREDRGWRGGG